MNIVVYLTFFLFAIIFDLDALPTRGPIKGITKTGQRACQCATADIMKKQKRKDGRNDRYKAPKKPFYRLHKWRKDLPQNPRAVPVATVPGKPARKHMSANRVTRKPQKISTSFTAATLNDANAFPPDSMGAVGSSQFILFINGRLRTFNKESGQPDGVLNVDPDVFFSSVNNGQRTSDPRIRYDRFTQRWFLTIINVAQSNNRTLFAVSDSADITSSTIWRFFFIDSGGDVFFDYATLGIDKDALYVGGATFSKSDTGRVYVVRKSSILGSGPIVFTLFSNLVDSDSNQGMYVPQGVDNFDSNSTQGYFIGVDTAFFGRLILRRVFNPAGIPSLSSDIILDVPTTRFPITVRHLGNTNGAAGRVDGIDDRLMAAHIRDGKLWTTHSIGVNNEGVSANGNNSITRNGCRWYEIDVRFTNPILRQSGTVYHKTSSNSFSDHSFWMPSLMTSGQGHMALGCNVAGSSRYLDATTTGRLSTTSLGQTLSRKRITKTTFSYNPPGDPGSRTRGRRWGDYSYTCLDPSDDMTIWTAQEFCDRRNSWGVRVAKLLAPPPAQPASASPSTIPQGQASVIVTVTGTSKNGSAYFDPGNGFEKRISAQVGKDVRVNSVTFQSETRVTLDLDTREARTGRTWIRIINPDGRRKRTRRLLTIV